MKMQQGIDNIKTMKELEERHTRQQKIFNATFAVMPDVYKKQDKKASNELRVKEIQTAVEKYITETTGEEFKLNDIEAREFTEKQIAGFRTLDSLPSFTPLSTFMNGAKPGKLKELQNKQKAETLALEKRLAKEQRESGVLSEDAELQSLKKQIENLEAAKKTEIKALENKSVKKSTPSDTLSSVMTNVMSLTSSKKAKEEKKEKEAKKSEDIAKAIKGLEDRYALAAKKLAEQCKTLEEKIERQNLAPERLEGIIIGIYNDAVKAGQEFSAENCSKAFNDKFKHLSAALQDNDKRQLEAKLTTMFESLHKSYKGEKINDDLAKIKCESSWLEWIRDLILLLPSSLLGVQTNSMRRNTFKKSLNETEKTVGSRSL